MKNLTKTETAMEEWEMAGTKPKILIVDDEPVVYDLLNDYLADQGYLCATALDGPDALTKLERQDFDAALLDIRLPGLSGIEVLREIASNHCNTVAVMITAVNDVDTAVEAIKLGASDYIVKPFDLDRVHTSVRTILANRQGTVANMSFASRLDLIALGVEQRLDPHSNFLDTVIETTKDIAWRLDIPKEEIERWAEAKKKPHLDYRRNMVLHGLLNYERTGLVTKARPSALRRKREYDRA